MKNNFSVLINKLLYVLGGIFIFRIGIFIPIPGVNVNLLYNIFSKTRNSFIDLFNMFSGGSLFHASVFALGIMPYITSSIVIQLLTFISPYFIDLKNEGVRGKYILNKYTHYLTFFIAVVQSIFVSTTLVKLNSSHEILFSSHLSFCFVSTMCLVTGTMFLVWLGDQLTEYGIGNGISLIIYTGIISNLPSILIQFKSLWISNFFANIKLICVLILMLLVIYYIVYIESTIKRIPVHYPSHRQQLGRYFSLASQNTYLPLKLNIVGVIPAIFSSSFIIFISNLFIWIANVSNINLFNFISLLFSTKQVTYIIVYVSLIILFSFFYATLVFDPIETANNLKKSGAYIPGIRPGLDTSLYINNVIMRLTLFNIFYIIFICLLPEFLQDIIGWPYSFGGTTLLIVIVVAIDFITQIQTFLISNKYLFMFRKNII